MTFKGLLTVAVSYWQLVCLATFLKVPESDSFDPYQVYLLHFVWQTNYLLLYHVPWSPLTYLLFPFAGVNENFYWIYRCSWTIFCSDTVDPQEHLSEPQIPGRWSW
jgi:hypothetical protein